MANSSVDLPQPDSPTIADELAAADVEVDVVDRHDRTGVGGVGDREVADLEDLSDQRDLGSRRGLQRLGALRSATGRRAGLLISSKA